jgi:uncharacterized membrane protein
MEYQSGAVRPVDSFSDGLSIIKNDYWMYVAMALVAGVTIIIASVVLGFINNMISGVISGAMGVATNRSGEVAQASAIILPELIKQIIGFFVSIIITTLSGVLYCGIYKSMSRVAAGARAEFGDLFSGFENIQACLIVAVVVSIIQFAIALVMLFTGAAIGIGAIGAGGLGGLITSDGQFNPAIFGGLALVLVAVFGIYFVIMIIFAALTTFIYPLIGERNLSGGQAFLTSVKSGLANLGGLVLMLLLGFLMILVAALPCGLGLPFVFPIFIAAIFSAYRSVFGGHGNYTNYNPPPPPSFGQQPPYGQPPRY